MDPGEKKADRRNYRDNDGDIFLDFSYTGVILVTTSHGD